MDILKRLDFTRTIVLVLLLAAATAAIILIPQQVWAACCGREVDNTYYSDASKTTEIGYCDRNVDCSGTDDCPGPTSPYFTHTSFCCEPCTP